jgi:antitoxin HicB
MNYPLTFKHYPSGQVGAFFPDVPEAITVGASEAEAIVMAHDALVVALSGYIDEGRAIPVPGKIKRGQPAIAVPPRAAIKLAIHAAMREQGLTQAQLGERLGVDGRQVRRILDLDHESKLSQLESALEAVGLRVTVSVSKHYPTTPFNSHFIR